MSSAVDVGVSTFSGIVMFGCALAVFTKGGLDIPLSGIVGVPPVVGMLAWMTDKGRVRAHAHASASAQ